MKFILGIFLTTFMSCAPAIAGLPPTSTKGSNDSNFLTTFNFSFPNTTFSHSGSTATWGTLGINGGGTGSGSFTAGSVIFSDGTKLTQSNSHLFWDDSNLRLGVGTTATTGSVSISGVSYGSTITSDEDAGTNVLGITVHRHSNTAAIGPNLALVRSRGSGASPTVVSSGDAIGSFSALAFDGTDYEIAASITGEVDGTPGSNDMPGRLIFKVTPDGSATPAEAMRISNDKKVTLAGTLDTALTTAGPTIVDSSGVLSSEAQLAVARGGTNISSYAVGDLLYASGTNTLAKVAIGTPGQVMSVSSGTLGVWANAYAQSTLTLAGTLQTVINNTNIVPANARIQNIPIIGNSDGVNIADITTTLALDGDRLNIIGTSDASSVLFPITGTSTVLNGPMTFYSGTILNLIFYNTKYYEIGRSN